MFKTILKTLYRICFGAAIIGFVLFVLALCIGGMVWTQNNIYVQHVAAGICFLIVCYFVGRVFIE